MVKGKNNTFDSQESTAQVKFKRKQKIVCEPRICTRIQLKRLDWCKGNKAHRGSVIAEIVIFLSFCLTESSLQRDPAGGKPVCAALNNRRGSRPFPPSA